MLGVAGFAISLQGGVNVGDDECVFNRDGGYFDAQLFGRALRVVARGSHNVFGVDFEGFFGGDKVTAFLDHNRAAHDPFGARPLIAVDLPLTNDFYTALACPFGHGHGDVGGVYVPVCRVIERAFQVFGFYQGPTGFDLLRCQKFVFNAHGISGGGVEFVLVHAFIGLGHAQVADHGEAGVQACLGF